MYQAHWGLEKPPFPSGADLRLFYEGASQREALARLRYLVDNGRRLGLVNADSGLGKSLLLDVFASECRQKNRAIAQVDFLGLTTREFLWQLGGKLRAAVRVEDDPVRLLRQLADRMLENRLQSVATVLLLDNVDQAGPDLIAQLLRLVHHPVGDGWLTLVVAANRSSVERLGDGLLEMVDLRIDLHPWDELDTTGYLQLALVEAGSQRPLFDDHALSELHRLAGGVPRRVNRLADYALLTGSSKGLEMIGSATIQSACEAIQMPAMS